MVYCNSCNIAVDIYLQSGTGSDTKSAYGSVVTLNRTLTNFFEDCLIIGKKMLDYTEFAKVSIGSNQRTYTTANDGLSGGHADTMGRRMISFIGCEECSGYRAQFSRITTGMSDSSVYNSDLRGFFGLNCDYFSTNRLGGSGNDGYNVYSGSFFKAFYGADYSGTSADSSRGCCDIN